LPRNIVLNMSNIKLPTPQYFDIRELTEKWNCTEKQLHDLAANYLLKIKILLVDTAAHNKELEDYFNERGRKDYKFILDGLYFISPNELQQLFVLSNKASESLAVKYVFDKFVDYDNYEAGGDHNPHELSVPIKATINSLRVDSREVERFEREFGSDEADIQISNINYLCSKRENNLLRTIGGLSLLLMDKNKYNWGTKNMPNINALSNDIQMLAKKLQVSDKGQKKSSLYGVIEDGIEIFLDH